jgi:hypothetical protein
VALEWQALEAPAGRPALYRRAADCYLNDEADPQSALRCYAAALDEAGPDDLDLSAEDSWLLMAIKNARKKEIADEK